MTQAEPPGFHNARYRVGRDTVEQGRYTAQASSGTSLWSNYPIETLSDDAPPGPVREWTLTADLSAYPRFTSTHTLSEALYALSLEELQRNTTAEGTFDAGAKWPGVWTRDVSYSILLALAAIDPEHAKTSLRTKVKLGRIVQDVGTGGSWPVSTDRVVWGLAAWEIYLSTGDRAWLQEACPILQDSMLDDLQTVVDPATGLAYGESTFLDWREQTYPAWMQPADIYQSHALGTNAVFYRAARVLALMCAELQQPCAAWSGVADRIGTALNGLFWQRDRGFYGQYRYGGVFPSLSSRADALGNALAILFDVAPPERQHRLMQAQPLMDFGIPTVYPQTPGIQPYHNDSVWPFVQAFWNLAAARCGSEAALAQGIAAMQRASALFLTNRENFVAGTGTAAGTAVSSDRQLWSVAGMLAMTYRVLFGMHFRQDGLHFAPAVPAFLAGTHTLQHFHYRGAVLQIHVSGFGNGIASFLLDGEPAPPSLPTSLTGSHTVEIRLSDSFQEALSVHQVGPSYAPATPAVSLAGRVLHWQPVDDAQTYRVVRDGELQQDLTGLSYAIPDAAAEAAYQLCAVDGTGQASFLSEPIWVGSGRRTIPMSGATAGRRIETEQTGSSAVAVTTATAAGWYAVQVLYRNGSGPVNTGNRCALRTLFIDGTRIGPIVLPQRGANDWQQEGLSSAQVVQLVGGTHTFALRPLPSDRTMSGEANEAEIPALVLTALERPRRESDKEIGSC